MESFGESLASGTKCRVQPYDFAQRPKCTYLDLSSWSMPGRGTEKQRGLLNEFSRSSVNGDGETVEKLTPLNTVN